MGKNTSIQKSYSSLEENYSSLQQNVYKLEQNNLALQERIGQLEKNEINLCEEVNSLKTKELENAKKVVALNKQAQELKAFEDQQIQNNQVVEEQLSSHTQISRSLQSRVEKHEEETIILNKNDETHNERITALEKNETEIESRLQGTNKLNERLTELETAEIDVQLKLQNLESADVFLQEAHRMLMGKATTNELESKQMDINLARINNKVQANIQSIAKLKLVIDNNTENITKHNTVINNHSEAINNNTEKINLINTKSVDTWQSIDNIMSKHNETITSINNLIGLDKQKIEDMESEMKAIGNSFTKLSPELSKTTDKLKEIDVYNSELEKRIDETNITGVRNSNNIKEIVSKITSQENRLEDFDNESETSKSRITKINEHMESITRTIQVFESRHSETIEKIKEVTVLASNIKAQEQKMDQQKANDFNQFNSQLEQLKRQQDGSCNKISDIDADHHTLMEKLMGLERNLDNRLKNLDEIDNTISSRLGNFQDESTHRIKSVEDVSKYNREKLVLLEDALQKLLQKEVYMENIGARVNQLDEMRQQSEAKAKDEVDATISQSNRLINTLQTEFEEKVKLLENYVKDEQTTLINKSHEINQEIMTIKSQTNIFSKKVEEISHENQTLISTRIGSFADELDRKIKQVDHNISSKLSKYENENRGNLDKIENQIQESTFIQAEKVQYVESLESKLNQMGEEHLKLEKQTREDLKSSIENNTKQIMQLKSEFEGKLVAVNQSVSQESDIHKSERDIFVGQINSVSTTIEALNQQCNALIAENKRIETNINSNIKISEDRFNQQEDLLQNSLVNYQEMLDVKLREVGEETKLNSKSLVEIEPLAKSIDSRLVMLQNSNAEKFEVLKEQILVENTHRIESFRSEVSTSLVSVSEKNESVEKHIQVFKDTSDKIKSDIQAIISKEQEIQQSKLSDIIKESELVTNDFRLKMDQQLSTISDNFIGQQEKFETIQSSMSSLVKKVHTIESSDTRQNDLLSKLEDQGDNLGSKLSSLESADIFLQEAHV